VKTADPTSGKGTAIVKTDINPRPRRKRLSQRVGLSVQGDSKKKKKFSLSREGHIPSESRTDKKECEVGSKSTTERQPSAEELRERGPYGDSEKGHESIGSNIDLSNMRGEGG